jgi:hypothetical protein
MVGPRSGWAGFVVGSVDCVGVLMVFSVKKVAKLAAKQSVGKRRYLPNAAVDAPGRLRHPRRMRTLAEIEAAIEQLPPQTFRELRRWIAERDASAWDAQIEADVAAGKFDVLREKVRADYQAGHCTDL